MAFDLPNKFLLLVFKKLSANDRLISSQVCLKWYNCIREVNQNLQCLTITVDCQSVANQNFYEQIDKYIFGYCSNMKQQLTEKLKKEKPGELEQLKFECSTKWNTLQFFTSNDSTRKQLKTNIVKRIINVFPATIELNFINQSNVSKYEFLKQMLKSNHYSGWKKQIKTLRVIELEKTRSNSETVSAADFSVNTNHSLFTAINRLPSLEQLDIVLNNKFGLKLLDLPVLSRLKKVRFEQNSNEDFISFIKSVQLYAADNDELQIDLPKGFSLIKPYFEPTSISSKTIDSLLDQHTRQQIVRLNDNEYINSLPNLMLISFSFPQLTSLSINCSSLLDTGYLLAVISMHFLSICYLKLNIDFEKLTINVVFYLPSDCFTSPMLAVKALELNVAIDSHDKGLHWLNLPVTMPNLAAVHFESYHCKKCKLNFQQLNSTEDNFMSSEQTVSIRQCFGEVFKKLLHNTSVMIEKVTIKVGLENYTFSAKQFPAI